ncbi:NAD kinase-like isoform X2 [Panonychus citri]|uniref:NAD kinase-like isoform X2 n=1 Tax=Panonychus citri TaxID=50023 RepID=UPI002308248B|nr:NAD kinase-like isoform X2 [Panonychus citri]
MYTYIGTMHNQRLNWPEPPKNVLVIHKIHDSSILPSFIQLTQWLLVDKQMVVLVEHNLLKDIRNRGEPLFKQFRDKLITFEVDRNGRGLDQEVDLVICLGGDGTLLYASSLFQSKVPPVMAFHFGSLGFLAPFEFESFKQQVTKVIEGKAGVTLRSRLSCCVRKQETEIETIVDQSNQFVVLNEVVLDRGLSPFLCNLDLYIEGKYITTVQGDGLIVSTPTGSTAYAVAAGASMVHPSVPAIMVTPICPHSLSFRPIVVPAGIQLKILVSKDSRGPAWVSFDGRKRQELNLGDELNVTTSVHPVPSICFKDPMSDWFSSLGECLHWNERKKQHPIVFYDNLDFAETEHNNSHKILQNGNDKR